MTTVLDHAADRPLAAPPEPPAPARRPLPVRRPDLIVRPRGDDGECVIKDPRTGAYFNLGPHESFLLARLDGQRDRLTTRTEFERRFAETLSDDDLDGFVELARSQGFLSDPAAQPAQPPMARVVKPLPPPTPPAKPHQSLLYWRKNVFDPDRFFTTLEPHIRFVWTRPFVVLSLAAIAAALALVTLNGPELATYLPGVLSPETLLLAWIALVAATTLHEFAHGLTCKHYGGEVHEVGFLLMYFIPCFYCNVSDAWLIPQRSRRMLVTLAGGYLDLLLWTASVFLWRLTVPHSLPNYLAWVILSVCGVRVFFNFNPLLKLDGYYLLSDWLEIPNLRQRSWDRVAAHLRHLLWGGRPPNPDPHGALLTAFGLASWLYSAMFLGLMLWGMTRVMGDRFGALGVAPAAALGMLTVPAMFRGLSAGEARRMVMSRNKRVAAWVLACGALASALLIVPMEDRAGGSFELRPAARAELRSPLAAFVRDVRADEGNRVAAGALVAMLDVPDLPSRIAQKSAEIAEAEAKVRVLQEGSRGAGRTSAAELTGLAGMEQINAARAQVQRLNEEARHLQSLQAKLPVRTPIPGVVVTPHLRERTGAYLKEGDLLCTVEESSVLDAEVAIDEQDVARLAPGQPVEIKARSSPFRVFRARVDRIAPATAGAGLPPGPATGDPTRDAMAARDNIAERPRSVIVYCRIQDASPDLRPGMTGYARILCGKRPAGLILADSLLRRLRTQFWW